MYMLRNLPVLLWWVALVIAAAVYVEWMLCLVVALVLAGPLIGKFMRPKRKDKLALPSGVSKYTTCQSMTLLVLTKAALGQNLLPPNRSDLADRS